MVSRRPLESLVSTFDWRGRRVFITGHTGFKGSWLALWLADLGAEITGFSLPALATPSLFEGARLAGLVHHVEGDIRDAAALASAVCAAEPEIVFHLAAQSLVRPSYETPIETYATNVMGTVHLLDACRRVPSLRGVVCVTSDKCYENREWSWPYRENDPMGGFDPYSSSKGAAELVVSAYRRSFFAADGAPLVASVRAGNVIGGGDWAEDRLIPDIIRALENGQRPMIRSARAVRPWQHVLEALRGYITIAERLADGDKEIATGWNFGPADEDARPVGWIVERMLELWGATGWDEPDTPQPHEAKLLRLDCSKARAELGWKPVLPLADALQKVVSWHRAVGGGDDAREVSMAQLRDFRAAVSASAGESSKWG
jgi:CDP-glucose 4,6-dehydratase